MSIFKSSFKDFVRDQLNIRQKIVSRGNSDIGSKSRTESVIGNTGTAGDKGAYYAYGQKQCVIRLASMVDLMKDIDLELGGSTFESYKGSTFARNFILEGGVLSDYARNVSTGENSTEVKVRKFEPRGGFPNARGAIGGAKKVNLSYGDPSLASDPNSDGYGVVAMPGIRDANVRTKSAYGSLREAKINFFCHNLRQLEILELLYMRPGYPVFMEWGWSPFINNDGTINSGAFPSIVDRNIFWSDDITQEYLQREVIKLKNQTNGNYDGFVGFVTNFDYSIREDGGFDCSTELISMGEVIDSLKVSPEFYVNLEGLTQIDEYDEDTANNEDNNLFYTSLGRILVDLQLVTAEGQTEKRENVGEWDFGYFSKEILEGDWGNAFSLDILTGKTQGDLKGIWAELIELLGPEAVAQGIIPKGTQLVQGNITIPVNEASFIRWDLFCELINKFCIPRTEKDQLPLYLSTHDFISNPDGSVTTEPLLYVAYRSINENIKDVSCNGRICILPHQFLDFYDSEKNIGFWGRTGYGLAALVYGVAGVGSYILSSIGTAVTAKLGLEETNAYNTKDLAFGQALQFSKQALTGEYQQEVDAKGDLIGSSIEIKPEIAERSIGNIFISIEHLTEIYKQTFRKDDATLGDYLKNLWDSINEVCPMHNFGLRTDFERPNVVQVIDLGITNDDFSDLPYDDLVKLNVISNDSIVRNLKVSVQLPSALKATVAINAQSGAGADDIDAVTFAAFNKNIKSRLHSYSEKFSENERRFFDNTRAVRRGKEERLEELYRMVREYNREFFNSLESAEVVNDDLQSVFESIKSVIKEVQTLELYLEKSSSDYLKNQSIIPIELNLELDGISGIVIGNVFRIDESRLPKDYRKGNVAFVALGEEQNITAGQDWTTKIKGQLILYPTERPQSTRPLTVIDETRISFYDINVNAAAANNAKFAVAESTGTQGVVPDQAIIDAQLGIQRVDFIPGEETLEESRNELINDGFLQLQDEALDDFLIDYELWGKQINDEGEFKIFELKTKESSRGGQGRIIDYPVNVSNLEVVGDRIISNNPLTISDIVDYILRREVVGDF